MGCFGASQGSFWATPLQRCRKSALERASHQHRDENDPPLEGSFYLVIATFCGVLQHLQRFFGSFGTCCDTSNVLWLFGFGGGLKRYVLSGYIRKVNVRAPICDTSSTFLMRGLKRYVLSAYIGKVNVRVPICDTSSISPPRDHQNPKP